jgi:sec-independent protein translocase protein TatA
MGSLGAPELLLIALIALIVFGTGRLPELGKGLGEGIRNFKNAMREGEPEAKAKAPEPGGRKGDEKEPEEE